MGCDPIRADLGKFIITAPLSVKNRKTIGITTSPLVYLAPAPTALPILFSLINKYYTLFTSKRSQNTLPKEQSNNANMQHSNNAIELNRFTTKQELNLLE